MPPSYYTYGIGVIFRAKNIRHQDMKIALAQLNFTVGDIKANASKIIAAINEAKQQGADLAVFAEFAVSGTPAYGLLTKTTFLTLCEEAVETIADHCKGMLRVPSAQRHISMQRVTSSTSASAMSQRAVRWATS